jgi:hypothetical protein
MQHASWPVLASKRACTASTEARCALDTQCERDVEQLADMSLPSLRRFIARSGQCRSKFQQQCIGPARPELEERLEHAIQRERLRFRKDYNDRLYSGLVVATLAAALLCRFGIKRVVPEMAAWASFIFLEVRRNGHSLSACFAADSELKYTSRTEKTYVRTLRNRMSAR